MSTNVTKFIADLAVHFPTRFPRPEMEQAWLQSMVRELKGYSASELDKAARAIIQTRKRTDFPLLADCKAACDEAKKWLDMAEAKLPSGPATTWAKDNDWADWRIEQADRLIIGPMGKQAAASNWILQLHDFIRKHQRLPNGLEVGRLKEEANIFDEKYAECVAFRGWKTTPASEPGAMAQAGWLVKLGNQMLARRAELADRVQSGVIG